jgi:cytidylate kinase
MTKAIHKLIIAIDGYSSCGKSTFAIEVAKRMQYLYIDSGAMYRAVTFYCLQNNLIRNGKPDEDLLIESLKNIHISFQHNPEKDIHEIFLNGKNRNEEIRSIEVSNYVSQISKIKKVREKMVELQRELGKNKQIVMDGRDIGTVVFPNADIKIFMTADPAIRAQRRYKELIEKGEKVDYDEIEKNIRERDFIDENREISPLRKANDAIILDNSDMSVKEQMEWIMDLINQRLR